MIVEGKRTESLSSSTEWFFDRSQLIRNLEAAKELARGRSYAVMVIAESELDLNITKLADVSLPHYNQDERAELARHFFGCITWREVCGAVGVDYSSLPDTTHDWIAKACISH